jgi:hypothetical protein
VTLWLASVLGVLAAAGLAVCVRRLRQGGKKPLAVTVAVVLTLVVLILVTYALLTLLTLDAV